MFDCRLAPSHTAAIRGHAGKPCVHAGKPCVHAGRSCPGALAPPSSLVTLLLAMALLLLFQAPVMAHRVNIFAWTEGPQIVVKSGFSGGNGVRNGEITVYDAATGKVLFEGRTNAEGILRFDIPPAGREHGLRIRINAGQGHQNEWQMEAAELAQVSAGAAAEATPVVPENAGAADMKTPQSAQVSQPAPQAAHQAVPQAANPGSQAANPGSQAASAQFSGSGPVSAQEVRGIVHAALDVQTEKFNALLDARLSPLRRQLAEMRTEGPGIREIVGGMGWFVGLAGLALYFRSRRR